MDKWIAYSISCGLSFLSFGFGLFAAVVPYGDPLAGALIASLGLTVFCLSVVCAFRETPPSVHRRRIAVLDALASESAAASASAPATAGRIGPAPRRQPRRPHAA